MTQARVKLPKGLPEGRDVGDRGCRSAQHNPGLSILWQQALATGQGMSPSSILCQVPELAQDEMPGHVQEEELQEPSLRVKSLFHYMQSRNYKAVWHLD